MNTAGGVCVLTHTNINLLAHTQTLFVKENVDDNKVFLDEYPEIYRWKYNTGNYNKIYEITI